MEEKLKETNSNVLYLLFCCFFSIKYIFVCFYRIIFLGLPEHIYLENISIISQYRYLLLLLFSLIILIYLIIQSFKQSLMKNIVPYFHEEVTRLLYTWNEGFIGTLCTFIINRLHISILFRQSVLVYIL